MESISLFVKRFLAFLAGPVISAGISFLIVPLTTWLVSPAEFGKASMYTLVVSLFSLVVYLGIDQAYVREYNESGDRRGLFMNSLILPLLFSLVVSSVVFLSWKTFSSTLFGKEDFLPAILFVVAFPFTVLERFNLLSIRMEEKARVYSLLTILRQLLRAPLLIFFLYYFRNFHGVIFAEASAQVLLPIFSGYVARKNWSTRFNLDKSLIKTLLCFGLPLLPASLLMWLFNGTATMSLRYWSSFEALGLYAAAFKIIAALNIFNVAFSTFWVPTAYRWYQEGVDIKKYEKVGNILCIIMTFIGFIVIITRNYVVLLLSPSYRAAADVMPFLVFIPVMYAISEVTVVGINFSKKTVYHIAITALSLTTNLFFNFLLVPKIGAKGAAISMGISYIVFFWSRTFFSRKLWKYFSILKYIINILLLIAFTFSIYINVLSTIIQVTILIVWYIVNRRHIKYMWINLLHLIMQYRS